MRTLSKHCIIGFLVRLLLIGYGELQDRFFSVPFTDIDYGVFMDAARYVTENVSPYTRSTYRYTPLLAYLLTPGIFLHHVFGKILFSCFDICIAFLIEKVILLVNNDIQRSTAVGYSLLWLYNPVSIVISTRGNSDSIICFLSLLTLYLFLKERYALAGICHGLSIHLRLFPIVYSLVYYLAVPLESSHQGRKQQSYFRKLIRFIQLFKLNIPRLKFVLTCIVTLAVITAYFFALYGHQFLYETYIYHLVRKDIRHNFSVYFFFLYLRSTVNQTSVFKIMMFLPQLVLLLAFSLRLRSVKQVPFCLLCLTFVVVMYNPVLTAQYFVWFLPFLPICLPNIKIERRKLIILTCLWLFMQLAWLLPAYQLEFKGQNTFFFIWWQSISFFCSNIAVLSNLIKAYQCPSSPLKIKAS